VTTYRRAAAFDAETLADDLILMNPATRAVVVLNATGRLVWEALAEGAAATDVATLFRRAFPGTAPEAIERDVAATIARLVEAGLAEAVEAS
jgi:hypothetical protein